MKPILPLALVTILSAVLPGAAAEKDTRCYELRVYYAAPGKLDALNARFRNHTCKLFEKHGMVNVGYWIPVDNASNKLVYVLAFPDREARAKSFRDFGADPAWKAVVKESEKDGRLVTRVDSTLLAATDFSPAIRAAVSDPARTFELRTYTASTGNLDNLLARFRNHTVALFEKHGIRNFGYWTPTDKKDGAGEKLIYLVAHKSQEAAGAAWAAFRADPDWVAAKKASEDKAGGSLTAKDGVKSEMLVPTDYSQTK